MVPILLRSALSGWVAALVVLTLSPPRQVSAEPLFASPHVHPLELTPDGSRLLAVNTEEHRLWVMSLEDPRHPVLTAEIPVGAEPVTVRARTNQEAWVVNHLSDNISVVDLRAQRVLETIAVGDEPTDVVFAGAPVRAFVCLSQEDRLLVFPPDDPASATRISVEGSDPRSLAVAPDGKTVYATILESGNQTTVVPPAVIASSLGWPPLPPDMNPVLPPPPETSLILRRRDGAWRDEAGRDWSPWVPYQVLDQDVIAVDADRLFVRSHLSGIGSSVFNVAVHPVTGELAVSAIDANNEVRFEPTLRGAFAKNVLGLAAPGETTARAHDLNPHIDRGNPAGSEGERAHSLALPTDLTLSADGRVWVAATGSDLVAVAGPDGAVLDRLPTGPGPTGVALSPDASTLYVLNRFAPSLTTWNLAARTRSDTPLPQTALDPEVAEGRRLFYRARDASAHGDLSCATCHIFGGTDRLAWDLGNPQGNLAPVPGTPLGASHFHPMKGPMVTQSLKGLAGTEPFHWRGDRANLGRFNPAFTTLLGRSTQLSSSELQAFTAFVMSLAFPPHPGLTATGDFRRRALPGDPARGRELFLSGALMDGLNCQDCHGFPTGESSVIVAGPMLLDSQDLNVPQLRDLHEKTGFDKTHPVTRRGFGFNHDGGTDNLLTLLRDPTFQFTGDVDRRDLIAFLLAFGSETHPAVGTSWEPPSWPPPEVFAAADEGRLGLYAKGRDALFRPSGWEYRHGTWAADREHERRWERDALVQHTTDLIVVATPPGSARRLGIDRDEDGHLDGDELRLGSDPADGGSTPQDPSITPPVTLATPRPNPAWSQAVVVFSLPRPGQVRVTVYDYRGGRVRQLREQARAEPGLHRLFWDLADDRGRRVPAGVYFIQLQTAERSEARKLTVLSR